ncbi:MAG: CDP-alcohol phosphatidyltransferase family protein [Candidatus Thermoplasmatota archaeon]|nr:CDP-alcohol phosphatidyltransferase family protein [Candidatus Thermoplasmatota archaeon]
MNKDVDVSFTVPDYITITNALLGFLSITYVVDGRLWIASMLIILCVILDGFDGMLARYLNVQHQLGAYLDFFSDVISFCFAPALLLYNTFYAPELGRAWMSIQNAFATLVPFLIVFLGTMRLARFVDKYSTKKIYRGLPSPLLALLVIHIAYLFGWGRTGLYHPYVGLLLGLLFSILLYCPFWYPKIRERNLRLGAGTFMLLNTVGFILVRFDQGKGKLFLLFTFSILLTYVLIGPMMVNKDGKEKN